MSLQMLIYLTVVVLIVLAVYFAVRKELGSK